LLGLLPPSLLPTRYGRFATISGIYGWSEKTESINEVERGEESFHREEDDVSGGYIQDFQ